MRNGAASSARSEYEDRTEIPTFDIHRIIVFVSFLTSAFRLTFLKLEKCEGILPHFLP